MGNQNGVGAGGRKQKTESTGSSPARFQLNRAFWHDPLDGPSTAFLKLSRQDARGQEEQQFLGRRADGGVLEQVANDRQAAEQRHLLHVGTLLGDDDAADNHGAAVRYEHLGIRFLGVDSRDALNARDGGVDRVVLDVHVHVDGAVRGNLRYDVEFQHGVDELDRNRVVDDGLHRDLGTLLDDGLLVVLGDDLRLGDELTNAPFLGGGDDFIQGKLSVLESVTQTAGRRGGSQVGQKRHRRRRRGLTVAGRAHKQRGGRSVGDRAGADRRRAADDAVAGGQSEGQLRADFTRERAVGGDDARFDFDLRGF